MAVTDWTGTVHRLSLAMHPAPQHTRTSKLSLPLSSASLPSVRYWPHAASTMSVAMDCYSISNPVLVGLLGLMVE